jgi:hypothetical protein
VAVGRRDHVDHVDPVEHDPMVGDDPPGRQAGGGGAGAGRGIGIGDPQRRRKAERRPGGQVGRPEAAKAHLQDRHLAP